MKFWKKSRYKAKRQKIDRGVKPSVSSLNPWSKIFFTFALAGLIFGSAKLLGLTEYEYFYNETNSVTANAVTPNNEAGDDDKATSYLTITPEELQNIQNTIAYTHAVWPGYKGDISDGKAVRNHFAQNLGKVILNNARGFGDVEKDYVVHFYYVVRKDGGIQYLAIVKDGRTSVDIPKYLIDNAIRTMSIGIPGITPGTNSAGEPITVVYELSIRYKPSKS